MIGKIYTETVHDRIDELRDNSAFNCARRAPLWGKRRSTVDYEILFLYFKNSFPLQNRTMSLPLLFIIFFYLFVSAIVIHQMFAIHRITHVTARNNKKKCFNALVWTLRVKKAQLLLYCTYCLHFLWGFHFLWFQFE